jgi:hypothetical protein
MAHQLSRTSKLVAAIKPTTVATSGTQSSTGWDMAGFLSVRAMTFMGQTSGDGVATLSILGSSASTGTFATLSGSTTASVSSTTGQMDGLLAVDYTRSVGGNNSDRWIRVDYVSATTLTEHGGVILEFYNPVNVPTTDSSTSMLQAQKVVVEGT